MVPETTSGKVVTASRRGYYFVQVLGRADVFVHNTAVAPEDRPLREGDLIKFTITEGPKGPTGVDVEVLERGKTRMSRGVVRYG